MTACLRLLRSKRWTERINLPEGHGRRFHIELARLGEECLFVEVVDREKRARALARSRSDNRRIGQGKSALVKKIASRLDDLCPHSQNRRLPLRTHPEMP